jgi:hypothetical protein
LQSLRILAFKIRFDVAQSMFDLRSVKGLRSVSA